MTYRQCPRTIARFQPGVPMEGTRCFYVWTGPTPNTGRYRCYMCGQDAPEEKSHAPQ